MSRRNEIRAGITDSLGVGLGIFPLGFALGMLVMQAGLPWWITPALSIGIFAGSVELFLVSMLAASAPLVTIGFAVLALNFRHVFYPFSFPLDVVKPGPGRWYSVYAMIDEAYATYAVLPRAQLSSTRMLTGQLLMQSYWVGGGLVGVVVATALPGPIAGFEFALSALFIVMTLDAIRGRAEIPSALIAAGAVTLSLLVVPAQALLTALVLFVLGLAVRYALTRQPVAEGEESP